MEIEKTLNGTELTVKVSGELDTLTAPELKAELSNSLEGITSLIFDFAQLKYVSSAGLRIILTSQKTMDKQGKMTIKNANEEIIDVFKITGFTDFLNIE